MRLSSGLSKGVSLLVTCVPLLTACAHGGAADAVGARPKAEGLTEVKVEKPVELRLKAAVGRTEKVDYFHRLTSKSFESGQLRHQKEESVEFASQAETLKVEPDGKFTQVITIPRKDGTVDLHGFALPEPGEKLEITADSRSRILKAGDYPKTSIFYVPPVSIPEGPVAVGDTWSMQSSWQSLEEGIPFQLDMVSILKGFWSCGTDTCAEIEISGGVGIQPPTNQVISFKSEWKGKVYFAVGAGTVVWSRTDSEEMFAADNVYRKVETCLESALAEPAEIRLPGVAKPACEPLPPGPGTELAK